MSHAIRFHAAVALTLFSAVAESQTVQTRSGLGVGVGVFSVTESGPTPGPVGCHPKSAFPAGGYLRGGGYLNPRLFAGLEWSMWVRGSSCYDFLETSLLAVVQWYPFQASGFYVKGGTGRALEDGGFEGAGVDGRVLIFGLGYDYRASQNFSLTTQVNYLRARGLRAPMDAVQYGLGLTWH